MTIRQPTWARGGSRKNRSSKLNTQASYKVGGWPQWVESGHCDAYGTHTYSVDANAAEHRALLASGGSNGRNPSLPRPVRLGLVDMDGLDWSLRLVTAMGGKRTSYLCSASHVQVQLFEHELSSGAAHHDCGAQTKV
jgi:hypothetical protein